MAKKAPRKKPNYGLLGIISGTVGVMGEILLAPLRLLTELAFGSILSVVLALFTAPVDILGAIFGMTGAVFGGLLGIRKLNKREKARSRSADYFYEPPPANRARDARAIPKGPLIERKGRGAVNKF